MTVRKQDERIDTVRAVACMLLVSFHVIGSDPMSGLRVPAGDPMRALSDGLSLVRMPLFTFISGVVYAVRPVTWTGAQGFMRNKAMRLLLPLVFVGYLFALMRMVTPGVNVQQTADMLPYLPFVSYAHFWFLQALFLIFIAIVPLEASGVTRRPLGMALALVAAAWLFLERNALTDLFSLNRAAYLLPFFLGGVAIRRFSASIHSPGAVAAALVFLPLLAGVGFASAGQDETAYRMAQIAVGTGAAIALLWAMPPIGILAAIGFYSFTVYLYHGFFSAASRIALERMGVESFAVMYAAGCVAGLAGPLALHHMLARIPYASRMLLGVRHKDGDTPAGHSREAQRVAGRTQAV